VNGRPPFDHRATALHWAALRGQEAVAEVLVARGADRTARDATYDSTPRGWAEHGGHHELAARL
jgi:ankyrin repeat protein